MPKITDKLASMKVDQAYHKPEDVLANAKGIAHLKTSGFKEFLGILKANGLPIEQVILPLTFHDDKDNSDILSVKTELPISIGKDIPTLYGDTSYVWLNLLTRYETDLANPHTAKRWLGTNPLKLDKTEKTTVARFLRKYFELDKKGYRDDQIRDLAQRIENNFKMPGLIFPQTAEEYYEMFTCKCNSCMTTTSTNQFYTNEFLRARVKEGRFPSEWYVHCPYVQGVMIKKGGAVVARTFLVRQDPTKEFTEQYFHTRDSLSTLGVTGEFVQMLDKMVQAKYKVRRTTVDILEPFAVPPTIVDGEYYMPLPFHDMVNYKNYYIRWYPETKMFECGPANKAPKGVPLVMNSDPHDFYGYISAKKLMNMEYVNLYRTKKASVQL